MLNTEDRGSRPFMTQPTETPGQKALFHSKRDIALIFDKTVKPGFGVLKAGTILSGTSYDDELVPYPTTDVDAVNEARIFTLSDMADTATVAFVTLEDSYKVAIGDVVMIANSDGGGTFLDAGAITAIDRTTYPNRASVTFTNAVSGTTFTTANSTNLYIKGDTAESDGVAAKYVLDKDIDTGTGENAVGALTSVVVSNAVINYGALNNLDAGAITDLGAVAEGTRFLILK